MCGWGSCVAFDTRLPWLSTTLRGSVHAAQRLPSPAWVTPVTALNCEFACRRNMSSPPGVRSVQLLVAIVGEEMSWTSIEFEESSTDNTRNELVSLCPTKNSVDPAASCATRSEKGPTTAHP